MSTRKEVAEYAGVSVATVSNVVNNTKFVSDDVRRKVEEAVRVLDYHPNQVARSLATKQSRHVAFVVDNLKNPYYSAMLEGIQTEATRHGYIVSAVMMEHSNVDGLVDTVSRGVDGLISAILFPDSIKEKIGKWSCKVLTPSGPDYRKGMKEAVRNLVELGHHQIAFLEGVPEQENDRLPLFKKEMKENGLKVDPQLMIKGNELWTTDENAGKEACERLIQSGQKFSAVITVNDLMAIGCIRCLKDHGLRVPEDVSVVGCDNIKLDSFYVPSLSTIAADSFELGRVHLLSLLDLINGKEVQMESIETTYIQRESVGPASR